MKLSWHFGLIADDLKAVFSGFSFSSLRFRIAVKTAAATCLAIFLSLWLEFKDPFFAGFAAMLMLHSNSAVTLRKAMHGCIGVIAGGIAGYIAVGLFVNDHFAFTICLFAAAAILSYLTNSWRSLSFLWYYASVNFILVSITGAVECSEAIDITFFRIANTLLGILCYVLVAVLLFPEFGHDEFVGRLDALRKKICTTFSRLTGRYASGLEMDRETADMLKENMDSLRTMEEDLSDIRAESEIFDNTAAAAEACLMRYRDFLERMDIFYESASSSGMKLGFQKVFGPSLAKIADAAESFASSEFDVEDCSRDNADLQAISFAVSEIETGELRGKYLEAKSSYEIEDVLLFLESLRCARAFLSAHSEKYPAAAFRNGAEACATGDSAEDPESTAIRLPFCGRKAVDWTTARFSLKGALAVITDFWAYFWLEIPGSSTTIAISAITVTKPDIVMTRHRSILRFSGCLLGAVCAFAFLAFNVQTTIAMFIWLFVLTFIFSMVWGGRPGVAYLGFQAELAFLLSVIPGAGPAKDVEEPSQRIAAILIGVAIAWFVMTFVCPEDILEDFRSRFRKMRESLAKMLGGVSESAMAAPDGQVLKASIPSGDYIGLRGNLSLIRQHAELTAEEAGRLDEFISAMEAFHRDARSLLMVDRGVLGYFLSANPGLADGLFRIGAELMSDTVDIAGLSVRLAGISDRITVFERLQREKNLLGEKPFAFREEAASLLLCLRRMGGAARRILDNLEKAEDYNRRHR